MRLERVEDNMIQVTTKTKGQVRITSRQFVPDPTGLEAKPTENIPAAKTAPVAKKTKSLEDDKK